MTVAATRPLVIPKLNKLTVELTNGALIKLRTVSPRPYLKLSRDSYNNPLWTSTIDTLDDDSGRLARFNQKFNMGSVDAWSSILSTSTSSSYFVKKSNSQPASATPDPEPATKSKK